MRQMNYIMVIYFTLRRNSRVFRNLYRGLLALSASDFFHVLIHLDASPSSVVALVLFLLLIHWVQGSYAIRLLIRQNCGLRKVCSLLGGTHTSNM